jgi:hypothetical protein
MTSTTTMMILALTPLMPLQKLCQPYCFEVYEDLE